MIVDLYHTILQKPEYFKPIQCGDLLFTRYDCPQVEHLQDLFCEQNHITFVISGKRTFHLPGNKIDMTPGKCVFSRKGAWVAEKESGQDWCVVVFFMPDSFLRHFINLHRSAFTRISEPAKPFQILELDVNETTLGFFHSMIPYFRQSPPAPKELVELKFHELLFTTIPRSFHG